MVSRTEFQAVLKAANLPICALIVPSAEAISPNVEISQLDKHEQDRSFFRMMKDRLLPGAPSRFKDFPPSARNAVGAAMDSMERRLANAVANATVVEKDTLRLCLDCANTTLDVLGFARHNRIGFLSPAAWNAMIANPEFAGGASLWGRDDRIWERVIWLRNRYLESQAALFHASAIEGGITPFEPKPGKSASASVLARTVKPDGVRILKWSV